jgi:DNA-binding NarL/FixJ family response regulator
MVNVLIADDHAIVRRGLGQILTTCADLKVVGEAGSGAEVLAKLRTCQAELLLLDLSMPGVSGIDLVRRVHAEYPALPILVVSIHNETQVVSRALRAGAAGYVTKDSEPDVLMAAIRKLAAGGRFIDPKLVDAVVFATHGNDAPPHEILSDREFQVLQMLASGKSISEIANQFSLSAKTVSTHKMRLMQKLDLENNAALIRYALKHGLATN